MGRSEVELQDHSENKESVAQLARIANFMQLKKANVMTYLLGEAQRAA